MMTQERKCQRYQSKRYRYLRTRKQNKQKSFMVLTSDIFSKNKFLDLVEIRDLLQIYYFLDKICLIPSFETEYLPQKRAAIASSPLPATRGKHPSVPYSFVLVYKKEARPG